MVLTKHSLVAYKNRPALVIENDLELLIELEDCRKQKVRSKDVILLHPGPILSISQLKPQSGDIEAAWEILSDEAVTVRELAELTFGSFTPSSAWEAWQLYATVSTFGVVLIILQPIRVKKYYENRKYGSREHPRKMLGWSS
jgi:exoribonuclease-2